MTEGSEGFRGRGFSPIAATVLAPGGQSRRPSYTFLRAWLADFVDATQSSAFHASGETISRDEVTR